jgi:hypothetical protein
MGEKKIIFSLYLNKSENKSQNWKKSFKKSDLSIKLLLIHVKNCIKFFLKNDFIRFKDTKLNII